MRAGNGSRGTNDKRATSANNNNHAVNQEDLVPMRGTDVEGVLEMRAKNMNGSSLA